jgi:DNA-binding NarL/FixJ family response regulator
MADSHTIRVLVVDDHPLMRSGIIGEIDAQRDMKVVAEAGDGIEAIAAFRAHRPDVTLMDIRMPNLGGIESIAEIRKDFPIRDLLFSRPQLETFRRFTLSRPAQWVTCSRTCSGQNSLTPSV